MAKKSTHTFYNYLSKIILVCGIMFLSSFIKPGTTNNFITDRGIQTKTIKCYPNPAISYINFEFLDNYVLKNYLLQVYSFTGKKMYEGNITSAKATLTFTNQYYRGIYVYQVQDKEGKILETGKFQVTR